jgi:subfamily B ATP-binding cassette protein MsbA
MTEDPDTSNLSIWDRLTALYSVARYRPMLGAGIVSLSLVAAILEGFGLSFLVPVLELAQGKTNPSEISGIGRFFIDFFGFFGLPFTLESVVFSVSIVMVVRYLSSFLVTWTRDALRTDYIRYLQTEAFKNSLNARVGYYDEKGSDEILNAIVTQTEYASYTILRGAKIIEKGFISLVYVSVTLYIAPILTIITAVTLGSILYTLRWVLEGGYEIGDRVADANERVQESVQAGTQGIRTVKLYGVSEEFYDDFRSAVNQFAESFIRLLRNKAILDKLYELVTAITVFVLIYVGIRYASLSLAYLGMFLFAMFRLAPKISSLNNLVYNIEGDLPHLVRTQEFIHQLKREEEIDEGDKQPPVPIEQVSFDDVVFSYNEEPVLDDVSFQVDHGEFIAFVGPSGAGKSTIVSLLARMYRPDSGLITAAGTPIDEYDLEAWRDRIAIVQQDPYIFNNSLRYNLTLGNREATEEEIREACEITQITEFLDTLPEGLDTTLGDDGVRLSGGQQQRVALCRALLKDADLVVLDEATSDLDSVIEERVHRAIETASTDYTLIVIAHRLSTIVNADRIYTMEDGEIVEVGSHDKLIDRDGKYARLYSTQSRSKPLKG